jgi:two-component system sensor histidine kinase and response regulator WspE
MKIDLSMVDLFKMELESHTKVLEKGLVDAEGETSKEKLEPLMRAAHSIKGAARIVGINLVVGLAHSMEDLLSLAIKGEILITDKHIDLLLQGNDFFKFVATLTAEEILPEVESNLEFINSISASLAAAAKGEVSHTPKIIKQTDSNEPVQQPNLRKERKEDALFVRVLADNLNRLLGLAGEIKIQAKFTKPFHNYLLAAKQTLREASRLNESLNSRIEELGLTEKFADKLDGFQEVTDRLETNISIIIEKFEIFSRNIERLSDSLGNEVIASKMRPISDGLHGIPRMVRDVAKDTGKKIQFEIIGEDTMIDRDILDKIEAPLSHLITNAIDHGIELPETRIAKGKPETGKIILEAGHRAGFLNISVIDNGKGIDENIIRKKIVEKGYVSAEMAENLSKVEILDFLFLPGFTTTTGVTKVSGRGVGLDIVMSLIHQVGGKSKVDSEPGIGSVFTLQLPVTLSVIRSLLIKINSELYALPLARVETLLSIREEDILTLEDRQYYKWNDENLGIVNCAQLMSLPGEGAKGQFINLAVIGDRTGKYAVAVDAFLGERDLVVTAIDRKLGKIPNIYAAAILEEGSIALIIDPDDLLRSIENYIKGAKPDKISIRSVLLGKTKKVLVVDDSLTVREVERKLIENNGYKVVTAVDGVDGFNTLQKEDFDLVITDVDMPRMNGIQLVEKIKSDPKFKDIPVMIVSYKDREEDRLRGLNAGANYYLTKSSFHDESLINAVVDLIGEAK